IDCQISVKRDSSGLIVASVVEAKDMESGATVTSEARKVDVGMTRNGKIIDSLVIVPAERTVAPEQKQKWSKGLTVLREALLNALATQAQDHQPAGDGPMVKAVKVDAVRAEHNLLYLHCGDGDRAEAVRKAFGRTLKSARNSHMIAGGIDSVGNELV